MMWNLILFINSIILSLVSVFFVYSIGAALILGEWKMLLIVFLMLVFFIFSEIALAALNM